MTENKKFIERTPINCIADNNSNCFECELKDVLICNFEKSFANKFLIGNVFYRIFAILILILVGLITTFWWMMITYIIVILLNFFIIEPRLLCSHCPFYAKDGNYLKCWALRGMPKLWKYRPGPMNKKEKIAMLSLGVFVDLFPYIGSGLGIVWFILNPIDYFVTGISIIVITATFTIIVIYFTKLLQGFACKHCPNFSCGMNKTPNEYLEVFLKKNPILKKAWEEKK